MKFARRRIRNVCLLIVAIFVTFLIFQVVALSLQTQQYFSGWVLVAIISGLLAFYVKKKLSVVPIGTNASWAQGHYYSGFFLIAVFLIHIEFSIPDGFVERILTALLTVVIAVGIFGVVINRVFARRLAFLGEEIIFERITELRINLKTQLEEALMNSVQASNSSTLSDYYIETLADYFSANRDIFSHLIGSRQPHLRRVHDLDLQMRYLNQDEADFSVHLSEFIRQKNTLDSHYALQSGLKYWGLFHAPIGVLTMAVVVFHIVLVYAFRGAV